MEKKEHRHAALGLVGYKVFESVMVTGITIWLKRQQSSVCSRSQPVRWRVKSCHSACLSLA